jgi:GNAT superfamily N-acetyltransferase
MLSFRDFIKEEDDLDGLRSYLDKLGVSHSLHHYRGVLHVAKIVVPKEQRNRGVGSTAMDHIKRYADANKKRITLTPSSDFGGSKPKLVSFYKRHGFIENKGRNKDFSTRESMYRDPK